MEMVVFDEDEESTRVDTGKRRAVLLAGDTSIWAERVETIVAEEGSDELVAVHPLTQESLTHQEVVELAQVHAANLNISDQQLVDDMHRQYNGHVTDQNAIDYICAKHTKSG